jgi:TPR repeat protein
MRLAALVVAAALFAGSLAFGQSSGSLPTDGNPIQERIKQGLEAANAAEDPLTLQNMPMEPEIELRLGIPDADDVDASLASPGKAARFQTTIDAVNIEQRIDKGLTAAGEESAFPPDYAYGAFQRGWFLTAFSFALDRAEQGDAVAQTLLGVLLTRGLGVKQDLKAAADWYGLAAQAGNSEALYELGRLALEGRGVEQDFSRAADHFQQAADSGHAVAARELAYLLLEGKGREKNAMLAAAYLRRAAGLGDMDAQYTLAGLYVEGIGVVANQEQAARWFGEAARNGHVGAQVEYAILLFNGRGVPKDEAGAVHWFQVAADADNPVAQVRLARLFVEGRGVEKNPAEAARWYLIARGRGHEDGFLEEWLRVIDPALREQATAQAERWNQSRRPWMTVARAPVDNSVE